MPIRQQGAPKVIFSVPVPDLTAGEQLIVRGEVSLSMCAPKEKAPCLRTTPFAPHFTAKIVLGADGRDVSGQTISSAPGLTCSDREHHCTLVIDERVTTGLTGSKMVNLVVSADGPGTSKDLMIVENDHGGLYVTRRGASASGGSSIGVANTSARMDIDNVDDNSRANVDRRTPHVIFRARLDDARPGDILDLDAKIDADINDGPCNPLIMHQVFVSTDDRADPEGSAIAELTAKNGTNCTKTSCTYKKSGAAQLPGNTPATVYIAVVARAGRSCSQTGDTWKVGSGSRVNLRLRR